MKLVDFIHPKTIWVKAKFNQQGHLFEMVAQKCHSLGLVTENFLPGIIEREKNFPTGLKLDGYAVAIPHTEPEHVNEEFIAVVTSEDGVPFKLMDDANEEVQVNVIFMLGLNSPHNQLSALQQLIAVIQDKDNVNSILQADTHEEITQILAAI